MSSLRNPIGPLPSSIYWRRRILVAAALILAVALFAWACTAALGGDGDDPQAGGDSSPGPAASITPEPGPSGPGIDTRPGGSGGTGTAGESDGGSSDGSSTGADEEATGGEGAAAASGGTQTSGGDGGADSGGADGSSGDAATGDGGASAGGASGSGGSGSGSGSGTSGVDPAALPRCAAGDLALSVTSEHNAYEPTQTPRFTLTVRNGGDLACAVDLGKRSARLTISGSGGERVWSSADCPADAGGTELVAVPAGGEVSREFDWERERSAEGCPTAVPGATPGNGTYLVVGEVAGLIEARISFRLQS
ncbi:hypothetical protein [Allostreptomyces psammosilenae]|uniref:Uncharacterized protein n=1 Tax=Allostreptomyces psammosilenae TaxID=1892865 RepID=A0A852ZUY4_9ACTN|nr:hypothetical protein [Allostreptomyces psammosilenae]NYI05735.1 hypothetical protein [Allostreptomyces psammosilenae]